MSLPYSNKRIVNKVSRQSPSISSKSLFTITSGALSSFGGDNAVIQSEIPSESCCGLVNVDFLSKKGQRCQLAKILLFTLVPIVSLSVITCLSMINTIPDYDTKNAIRQGIYISLEIGNVVHHIQIERGTSVLYLSAYSDPRIFEMLQKNYRKSNAAIDNLKVWPVYSKEDPQYFKSKNAYFSRIQEYRQLVVANNVTRKEVIKFYSDVIASIIRCLAKCASLSMSGELWRTMVAYHMLLLATDAVGVERALGSSFYAEGNTSQTDLAWYIKMSMAANTYLNICSQYSKPMAKLLSDRLSESKLGGLLDGRRWQIISNISTVLHTPSAVLALKWFDNMTVFVDILQGIQDTSGKGILADLETDLDEISTKHNFSIVLVVGAIILYPTILMVVFKLTKQIQAVAVSIKEQAFLLSKERKRSEALLYQILPVSIAKKLMRNERVEPQLYKSATVLFSDIVGFTSICSTFTPFEVMDLLNLLYRTFDAKLGKYDVYKVDTIGDSYMVVSGLPDVNEDRHVSDVSYLAFDLLDTTNQLKVPQLSRRNAYLNIRIGINTGPVVTGIVGRKMPRYCLFGDTVNVASRMESTGKPQQIHISSYTAEALTKYPYFKPVKRGLIEITGKGRMMTYWLMRTCSQSELHVPGSRPLTPQ